MTDEPLEVLDLFAGKKGWSRRFTEAGHHVVTTDIDPAFRCNLTADILTVTADDLRRLSLTGHYDLVLASPPCEAFSNAALSKNWWALATCLNCGEQVRLVKRVKGSRGHTWEHTGAGCDEPDALIPSKPEVVPRSDKARLGMALVEHTLKLIADLEPRAWVMENPTAMMRRLSILADVELRPVTYCRYGMSYKKPTDLWGNFPPTLVLDPPCDTSYRPLEYADVDGKTYVVDATTGQPCHEAASRGAKTGLQGVDNAADRALVPDELSQAVLDAVESWRAFGWSL